MASFTTSQTKELEKLRKESHNIADMIEGCKNRMCICDTKEELDSLFIAIMQYANQLYTTNKRRLYVTEYPDFDNPPKITL